MLASVALVGCTNEDPIDAGNEELKQSELTRGDAYVNFVINTKTDSSRGVTGSETDTSGDTHTGADDNNHHVSGTTAENTVSKLLLVIAKVDDSSTSTTEPTLYTEVMTEASNKVANGYVGILEGNEFTNADGVISMAAPIRLDYTGKYAVLAVINPAPGLEAQITEGGNHKAAYEAILAYNGNDAYSDSYFQMSNKEACVIEALPTHNDPLHPVTASIAVERTVSKTTWRWVAKQSNLPGTILPTKENVYSVDVAVKKQSPEQGSFWYKKVETAEKTIENADGTTTKVTENYDTYYYSEEFNKAVSSDGKTYWVLFKKNSTANTDAQGKIILNEVEAIFENLVEAEQYKGVIDDTDKKNDDDEDNTQSVTGREITDDLLSQNYATAQANVTASKVASLTFVYNSTATETDNKFYVHLTHYALTNLTQNVYAVRHIDDNDGTERKMGVLASGEYLSTPYYASINTGTAVTFDNNLATVEAAAAAFTSGVTGTIFKALPTSGSDGTTEEGDTEHDNKNVGGFMQYLYENSCKTDKVNASTVTGIVLAGDIYDETGVKVPVLYKYNQKYYRTLQALVNALDTDKDGVAIFTKGETTYKITANSTNTEATAAGIDVYENGRCYYYSAQIKHFDNGVDAIGVMEYAIMRNNIYSLAVKSIKEIGDARVDVTENTPISDIRAYVDLEVSILPWIVRFNDLDL